jgi:hypothetical protein
MKAYGRSRSIEERSEMKKRHSVYRTIDIVLLILLPLISGCTAPLCGTKSSWRIEEHVYKQTPQGDLSMFIHLPQGWKPTDSRSGTASGDQPTACVGVGVIRQAPVECTPGWRQTAREEPPPRPHPACRFCPSQNPNTLLFTESSLLHGSSRISRAFYRGILTSSMALIPWDRPARFDPQDLSLAQQQRSTAGCDSRSPAFGFLEARLTNTGLGGESGTFGGPRGLATLHIKVLGMSEVDAALGFGGWLRANCDATGRRQPVNGR